MEEETRKEGASAPVENTANTGNRGNATAANNNGKSGSRIPLIIAGVVIVLAALVYLFIRLGPETTGRIRDISVIIFVLESIVTVTALVVLAVQAARLCNFLKYELRPILSTTQKTAKRLSGTVSFICDNAVEPTVKAASTVSGIKNAANGVLSLFKK